jgi:hypothetical protein
MMRVGRMLVITAAVVAAQMSVQGAITKLELNVQLVAGAVARLDRAH